MRHLAINQQTSQSDNHCILQVIGYTTDRSEGHGNGAELPRTRERKQNQWQHAMYVAQLHKLAAEQQWEHIGGHILGSTVFMCCCVNKFRTLKLDQNVRSHV